MDTKSWQASTRRRSSSDEITITIRQDYLIIGRITTTFNNLTTNQLAQQSTNDMKAKVRAMLRRYYYDQVHSHTQCIKSITVREYLGMSVQIRYITGKTFTVPFKPDETFSDFKLRFKGLVRSSSFGESGYSGILNDIDHGIYMQCARKLKNENHMTLSELGFQDQSMLVLSRRSCGGGGPLPLKLNVDLTSPSVYNGVGIRPHHLWESFYNGFSILGKCNSNSCISDGKQVCVNFGFPTQLILTDTKNTVRCPACNGASVTCRTFLVCAARAKITFRKSFGRETETINLESISSSYENYSAFVEDTLKKNQQVTYDYMEITAVKFGLSFNKCQSCSCDITIDYEQIFPCGRAFHKGCTTSRVICPVCAVPEYRFDNLSDVVASAGSDSIYLNIPNHQFGNCSTARSNNDYAIGQARPHENFMRELASAQLENMSNSGISVSELQESFICNNLPFLIRHTTVTTEILIKLKKLGILSDHEETDLTSTKDEIKKCQRLYQIIVKKNNGISTLQTALKETGQHRAAINLSMFDNMLASYSAN